MKKIQLTENTLREIIRETIENILTKTENIKTTKNPNLLYHGSPHKFDKFSLNFINTGQHSQDFGKGLYFTTDKETAIFYANELSNTVTLKEKFNKYVHSFTDEDGILTDYINNNYTTSVKRIVKELINNNIGNKNELETFLKSIDNIERYGYVYTVNINNPNYISRDNYVILQRKYNLSDDEMNDKLLNMGYNGIIFDMNNRKRSNRDLSNENNVVIINDNDINIIKREKYDFNGLLKFQI